MNRFSDRLFLLKVKLELSWGFSVRLPGTSASEPTLKLPPPTTLIGALARGLAYTLGLPEVYIDGRDLISTTERLNETIKSAHLAISANTEKKPIWSVVHDIIRMQALQYMQPKYWKPDQKDTWFGIHAVGRVYMPSTPLEVTYVIDGKKANETLKKEWKRVLVKSAFSMTAIGVKESIVSIDDVTLEPVTHILEGGEEVCSRYYFPSKTVNPMDLRILRVNLMEDEYWDPKDRRTRTLDPKGTMIAKRITYIIPIGKVISKPITQKESQTFKFRLSDEGVALTELDSIEEAFKRGDFIITFKEWLN